MSIYEYKQTKIEELELEKSEYVIARSAILKGAQEYTIKDRSLKRADLKFIQEEIDKINQQLLSLQYNGGSRFRPVIPRDR